MARLDGLLKKNGSGFFVGAHLTFVDLIWWYWLENYTDQGLIDVSKYDLLHKFKTAIEARPHIATYRKNPARYPVQFAFPRFVMYSYAHGSNAYKTMITSEFAGIKVEYPPFEFGKDNKTPDFLRKNPNGEVPTLESPDGCIYESNAIAKYIARKGSDKGLYGSSEYEASIIDQWIEWTRSKLENHTWDWVGPVMSFGAFDQGKYDAAKSAISAAFTILNASLEGKEWIVGKRTTLADIITFCTLFYCLEHVMDPEFLKPFPNVHAWATRFAGIPEFKAHISSFTFCTKEKPPGALKF